MWFFTKSDKNNGYFTLICFYVYDNISPNSFLNEQYFSHVTEKLKTHISFSVTFFPKNRAVYEVMWIDLFWMLPVLEYLCAILGTALCFLLLIKTVRLRDAFWLLTLCLIMLVSLGILLPY
jgi:hypothetical protein